MSFLLLMAAAAAMGWLASFVLRRPMNLRDAMRIGAAGAFLFTGVDHFISTDTRYLPMMPAFFGPLLGRWCCSLGRRRSPAPWLAGAA